MPESQPRWVQPMSATAAAARIRLFCFPYAGGGAAMFRDWARALPDEVGVYGIQLPGRESRMLEPAIGELGAVLAQLQPAILPYLNVPFAFFGHSMGAVMSWELARSLKAAGRATPVHLFVSGSRPLPVAELWLTGFESFSDAELADEMRKLNGTPEEVMADADLLSLVLPGFRSDLSLLAKYRYQPGESLDCPATVFGGDQDPVVPADELGGWAELTTGDVQVRVLAGDHFFLLPAQADMLTTIAGRLGVAGVIGRKLS
jgi:medium-chain acyl-[acyl-carrier-protein] hydrolase